MPNPTLNNLRTIIAQAQQDAGGGDVSQMDAGEAAAKAAAPTAILPGSGGPDHPGVIVNEPHAQASQNWVGGGVGRDNYYQMVIVEKNGHGGIKNVERATYQVDISWDKKLGAYSGTVRAYAEMSDGGGYSLPISSSTARIVPELDPKTKQFTGNYTVTVQDAHLRTNQVLDLYGDKSANAADEAVRQNVDKAAWLAFSKIRDNLTDGAGGPMQAPDKNYRAVMQLPTQMQVSDTATPENGGLVVAQVGDKAYYVNPYGIDQFAGNEPQRLHMDILPNGFKAEKLLGVVTNMAKKQTPGMDFGFFTDRVWIDTVDGKPGHQRRTTEIADPQTGASDIYSPNKHAGVYADDRNGLPDNMVKPTLDALDAGRMSSKFLGDFRTPWLKDSFIAGADGRPDCPWQDKYTAAPVSQPKAQHGKIPQVPAPGQTGQTAQQSGQQQAGAQQVQRPLAARPSM